MARANSVFAERNQKGFPNEQMLAATQHRGVIPKEDLEFRTVTAFKNLEQFKLVCPNDFVISLRSFEGGFEHSAFRGIISPAYFVFEGRNRKIVPSYWKYLFKSYPFLALLRTLVVGIRDGQTIRFNDFKDNLVPIPNTEEQAAIGSFLDDKTAQIDTLIEKKRKLIELLKEERQAVINEAVTKGINPKAKMKPSGVEWLGDVPEGWEVRTMKRVAALKYGLGQPPKEKENGLPLIRATNVDHGRILTKDLLLVDPQDIPYERDPVLRENDIIVVRSGAYTGDSAIIPKEYEGAIAGYDMVVRPTRCVPRFLAYSILSNFVDEQFNLCKLRAAQPHLNVEDLGDTLLCVPDRLSQDQITEYLDEKTGQIDEVSARTEKEIALLQEYRTALITEVVTGKVCVLNGGGLLL